MEELDFYGKMIYREGWFLYFRRNGQVCVLTREDARMIEYSYEKYREYELSQDSMSRMYEGTYPFEEYGFTRAPIYSKRTYKVDELAPESEDVVIGDVLEIPESVDGHVITSICDNSFYGSKIKKLILPKSVTLINRIAFSKCDELTEIITGGTVRILKFAFDDCPRLETTEGLRIAGNMLIGVTPAFSGELIIPENIDSICTEALRGNKVITSVTFPRGIKLIGESAFKDCENLKTVTFTDGVSDLVIEGRTFTGCINLSSVKLPEGLTEISKGMFHGCHALDDIHIPESVHTVRWAAFHETGIYQRFKESEEICFYLEHWLITIKDVPFDDLIVRKGTVGVAENASENRRKTLGGTVALSPSVRYLNDDAFRFLEMERINLANVERIGRRAVGFGRYKTLDVPATCTYFAGGNLVQNGNLKDVYFHNPDMEVGDLICKSGDGEKIRIHGFAGTAVELECATNPYEPPVVFVPDMK